jgi:hypothetical protein
LGVLIGWAADDLFAAVLVGVLGFLGALLAAFELNPFLPPDRRVHVPDETGEHQR